MGFNKNRLFINRYEPSRVPAFAPVILDDQSLSYQLGIDNRVLWWVIVSSIKPPVKQGEVVEKHHNPFYTKIEIPKPKGGVRTVYQVNKKIPEYTPMFKILQSLSTLLFKDFPWPEFVDAYVPGKSTTMSAQKHAGKKTLVCMDIKQYFPSITRAQVRRALIAEFGMNGYCADLVAGLVTLEKRLPQGSPIAPEIANLVGLHAFDREIVTHLPPGWEYSRYSDDIIFSHTEDAPESEVLCIKDLVVNALHKAHFSVNEEKVRVYGVAPGRIKSMRWLGMTINQKVNATQHAYKTLRQILYYCSVQGFVAQAEYHQQPAEKFKQQVVGMFSYLQDKLDPERVRVLEEYIESANIMDALNVLETELNGN